MSDEANNQELPLEGDNPENEANEAKADGGDTKDVQTNLLSNIGQLQPRPIVQEMEESYLDYAMSVIVARALPDARDGLKPVHRRILVTLDDLNLSPGGRYRKCAKICGDVSGNYHPHGEAIVYPSLVRLAQTFSLRYPLVIGQGNFGSIDGDGAAAMRYTEAKMSSETKMMLQDLDKNTVDYQPNYDSTKQEPKVLPAAFPNLLANGSVGIAVGMATNIPPHNLNELLDATVHLIDNPEASVDDLLEYIKGPDFPTGGLVYASKVLKEAYQTGRGSIIMRARAEIEETKSGRHHIRIWEIPYQVNKENLIIKMAKLVSDKVIQGVSDIRDESDREGIRIIIEIKRDGYPQKILNQLFKLTELQKSFGYNMIALSDGIQPRLMNVQELIQIFIDHRREVVRRRITYERDKAKERAHILEGLKIALDNIDAVIETIKKSKDKEVAKVNLIKSFKLSDLQADAILQMRLQTLSGLERQKIEDELAEKLKFIAECEELLASQTKMDGVIKTELKEIKEKFGDERRTTIVPHAVGEFSAKDTIPNSPMIVALTKGGYVKRLSPQQFRAQHRGGKGVKGMATKEDDEIMSMRYVMNHDDLLFFTNTGRVFTLPAYEVPQAGRTAKGQAIVNLLQLQKEEKVTAVLKANAENQKYLFMVTEQGTVKRTEIDQFQNIRRSGLIAQKINDGDELKWVVATSGQDEILMLSRKGKAIRFKEEDVRAMGRSAAGVRGIKLSPEDYVVQASVVADPEASSLLVVMENGLGKVSQVSEYRLQGRGGTGVKAAQLTAKTGEIVGGFILISDEGDLICLSKQGQAIRMSVADIPTRGRATQGVIVMRLKDSDKVASLSLILVEDMDETAEAESDNEETAPQQKLLQESEEVETKT